jgi:membrane-associated phospholipid phosphatase
MFIFDYIGFHGPIILSAITFLYLLKRPYYLMSFIIGSTINANLNFVLKDIFREPRPTKRILFNNEKLSGSQVYGFPSGHAQIVSFAIAFLYFANGPYSILYFMTFILFLTLYQRWKYRLHSIKQLVFGVIFGGFFAWTTIYFTKRILSKS